MNPASKPDAPKPTDPKAAEPEEVESTDEEDDAHFAKMDVHLRETLRVIADALALSSKRELWVGETAPLTAKAEPKS